MDRNSLITTALSDELATSPRGELLRYILTDQGPPNHKRVYVNRTLRMEKIGVIGFDLDWTLADYNEDALSDLAFGLVLDRLVERHGYPKEIFACEYRPGFSRRGLIIDTEAGTILKMNRHRYVGRAYHGRSFLGPAERGRLYRQEPIQPADPRYHFVDTLFEMPEVQLFSELVHLRTQGVPLPEPARLFRDARTAMDSIHADETLKSQVLEDLPRYLPRDPQVALALQRLSLEGCKLLLITNSEWYYTSGICSHLFDGLLPGLKSWRDLFDLVIVDAAKPGFFRKRQPFLPLENGQKTEDLRAEVPEWGGCYSGGSREGLMVLLDCPGEQVLYIGDHIYGDILSSKRVSTWRTALVVRELEDELKARQEMSSQIRHADVLRAEIDDLGRRMDDLADFLQLSRDILPDSSNTASSMERAEAHLAELRLEHKAMRHHKNRIQGRISTAINPYWGSVFRQGSNKSLFGSQVDDFACIYTSRVSNFAHYGRNHYFRVLRDGMMNDQDV